MCKHVASACTSWPAFDFYQIVLPSLWGSLHNHDWIANGICDLNMIWIRPMFDSILLNICLNVAAIQAWAKTSARSIHSDGSDKKECVWMWGGGGRDLKEFIKIRNQSDKSVAARPANATQITRCRKNWSCVECQLNAIHVKSKL